MRSAASFSSRPSSWPHRAARWPSPPAPRRISWSGRPKGEAGLAGRLAREVDLFASALPLLGQRMERLLGQELAAQALGRDRAIVCQLRPVRPAPAR